MAKSENSVLHTIVRTFRICYVAYLLPLASDCGAVAMVRTIMESTNDRMNVHYTTCIDTAEKMYGLLVTKVNLFLCSRRRMGSGGKSWLIMTSEIYEMDDQLKPKKKSPCNRWLKTDRVFIWTWWKRGNASFLLLSAETLSCSPHPLTHWDIPAPRCGTDVSVSHTTGTGLYFPRSILGSHSGNYEELYPLDITLCSPLKFSRYFGGTCRFHLQGR
jgi:hypothetical protein